MPATPGRPERIVITGASRGVGLALAREHAARGAEVWGGCRQPATAADLRAVTDHVLPLDVAAPSSITAFAGAVGPAPVDVLYNNAGVTAAEFGVPDGARDVLQLDPDAFLGEMRVNALGPMLVARALLPLLRAADRPRVVNMSSVVGSIALAATMGRDVGYAASKAALNMITVKLAHRLRDDGVIVVALHPGLLRTAMGGARGERDAAEAAADIATLVDAFTAADSGSFRRWDGSVHPW